ncbi:MAG: hypothetical protein IJZ02_02220 [Clostridia bacterium]|nr:hypothetical protein [Clostridia bacterium]
MRTVERLKTVLFVGLFLSSAILSVFYIADASAGQGTAEGNLPAEVLAVLMGNAEAEDSLPPDSLMPAFFGMKQAGEEPVGIRSGTEMMRDLNELISPWIGFAMGEGSVCTAEADAARWKTCLSANAFFYLRWDGEFPAAILRAYALPEDKDAMLTTAEGELPRIHEIFLFPQGQTNDGVCAVSRDLAGQVSLWRQKNANTAWDETLPDFDDFSIYQSRGILQSFDFAGELYPDISSRLQSLPVLRTLITLPALLFDYPLAQEQSAARISDFVLECLGYNLNKATGYYESETDTAVFVETHGTLRATADTLTYEATDRGGLSVGIFLEKDSTAFNLRDDLAAGEALVAALRRGDRFLLGGAAEPRLTSISLEGDTLILTFSYFYENVRVDLSSPAVTVAVRDHTVVSVTVRSVNYVTDEYYRPSARQQWMLQLSRYLHERDGIDTDYAIVLSYRRDEADNLRLIADWGLYLIG